MDNTKLNPMEDAIALLNNVAAIAINMLDADGKPKTGDTLNMAVKGIEAAYLASRATDAPAQGEQMPPDTSQDWAKLDGATAFHLIERHADDWVETGRMMEAWGKARFAASADAAPAGAVADCGCNDCGITHDPLSCALKSAAAEVTPAPATAVAWALVSKKGGIKKLAIERESVERRQERWLTEWPNNGSVIRPLVFGDEAAPATAAGSVPDDPLDTPLPCDITVGAVTIRKGVKLRTLVTRMESLHRMARKAFPEVTPEQRAAPSARTLTPSQIDDMCFGYAPSGKIEELRDLVAAVLSKSTPAEAPSVRDQALEEAAKLADSVGHHWSGAPALAFFALATRIRALQGKPEAGAQGQAEPVAWVSVAERLPAKGEHVIAYRPTAKLTQDDEIRIVRYTAGEKESWQGVIHGFDCICHPTYWMPLPAAPTQPTQPAERENS